LQLYFCSRYWQGYLNLIVFLLNSRTGFIPSLNNKANDLVIKLSNEDFANLEKDINATFDQFANCSFTSAVDIGKGI